MRGSFAQRSRVYDRMTKAPELARTVTIAALARQLGMPRRKLWRRLTAMHRADVSAGVPSDWLFRPRAAMGAAWAVNLSRLRAAHPELFEAPSPEEVQTQLVDLWDYVRHDRKRLDALLAAFREHRRSHESA